MLHKGSNNNAPGMHKSENRPLVMQFFHCRVSWVNYHIMAASMDTPVVAGRRRGVRRAKKHNLKTDMTPMVDLGFLLIAFFVVTTELMQPKSILLNMPHDGKPMSLGDSNALTLLLGRDRIYYYQGEWDRALATGQIFASTFDIQHGIGKVIREKQQYLDKANIPGGEGRDRLMLLIKANELASYENVIDALDEALIHVVKKYAILKPVPAEMDYLANQNQ
jgi:biopolymer transport protein ExbD